MTYKVQLRKRMHVLLLCLFTLTFDLYGAVKTTVGQDLNGGAGKVSRGLLTTERTLPQANIQPEIQITRGKFDNAVLGVSSLQILYSASNITWKEIKCVLRGPTVNSERSSSGSVITEWNPCPSVVNIKNFEHEGNYLLTIEGVPEGEAEKVQATSRWIIDYTPPRTRLNTRCYPQCPNSGKKFTFSGVDRNGIEIYECKLDSSPWFLCTSPYTARVDESNATVHTFQVRAVDHAGHVDPTPATHTWTSDEQVQSTAYLNRGSGGGHGASHSSHSSHSEGSHSEGAGAAGGPSSSGAVLLKFTLPGLYSLWPLLASFMWYLL